MSRSRAGRGRAGAVAFVLAATVTAVSSCSRPAPSPVPPAPTPTPAIAQVGTMRPIAPNYLGVNLDAAATVSWTAPTLLVGLRRLAPGTVRFPGGGVANYWDWRTGWLDPQGVAQFPTLVARHASVTLADLSGVVRAGGSAPVFALNVMTSGLADQVAMLRAAQADGLAVRYLELGNAVYGSAPEVVAAFPSAGAYVTAMTRWITVLHQDFPSARIAVVGAWNPPAGSATGTSRQTDARRRGWNETVTHGLRAADALTLQVQVEVAPELAGGLSVATLPALFAQPYQTWLSVREQIDVLPADTHVWVTQFGVSGQPSASRPGAAVADPLAGTWAHGLYVAEMVMLFLADPRIDLVEYTALAGGASAALVAGTGAPTVAGRVLELVGAAMRGATSAATLDVTRIPTLSGGRPALLGWLFHDPTTTRAVLLNLAPTAQVLRSPAPLAATSPVTTVTGDPVARGGAHRPAVHTSRLGPTLTLPPYSLTLVGVPAASSG